MYFRNHQSEQGTGAKKSVISIPTNLIVLIIWTGFLLRIFVAVWNGFWGPSLGAGVDAIGFHRDAVLVSNGLNFHVVVVNLYSYWLGVIYLGLRKLKRIISQ